MKQDLMMAAAIKRLGPEDPNFDNLVFLFNFQGSIEDDGPYQYINTLSYPTGMPTINSTYTEFSSGTSMVVSSFPAELNLTSIGTRDWCFEGYFEVLNYDGFQCIISMFNPTDHGINLWLDNGHLAYFQNGQEWWRASTVPLNEKIYLGISKIGNRVSLKYGSSGSTTYTVPTADLGTGQPNTASIGIHNRVGGYTPSIKIYSCRLYIDVAIDITGANPVDPLPTR